MIEPYYDEGGILIYHGDALAVLNALGAIDVAAIVTDPPYASGARTEAKRPSSGQMLRGQRFAAPITNDQMTTLGFVWLMRQTFGLLMPNLRQGGSVLSFIDWRSWPNLAGALETLNLRVQAMIVWDKLAMGMGNGFRSRHELIAHASKGTPTIHDRSRPNVLAHKRESRTAEHPSPKPVTLMVDLLSVVSVPGDLIVDPFIGCGSTLIAARQMGRRAIGVEIEERYCEAAAERLGRGALFGAAA